jgi:hypothetical protein
MRRSDQVREGGFIALPNLLIGIDRRRAGIIQVRRDIPLKNYYVLEGNLK